MRQIEDQKEGPLQLRGVRQGGRGHTGRLDRMQGSDHLQGNTGPGKEVQLTASDLRFVKTWKRDCPKMEAEARGPVRELLQWS